VPEAIPAVEHFNERIDDDAFAELAWPQHHPPVALLAGDQMDFAPQWQQHGWKILTPDDLQARGISYLIDVLALSVVGA
jgi:DEAD/DEAH box helicase domain-containing protein